MALNSFFNNARLNAYKVERTDLLKEYRGTVSDGDKANIEVAITQTDPATDSDTGLHLIVTTTLINGVRTYNGWLYWYHPEWGLISLYNKVSDEHSTLDSLMQDIINELLKPEQFNNSVWDKARQALAWLLGLEYK